MNPYVMITNPHAIFKKSVIWFHHPPTIEKIKKKTQLGAQKHRFFQKTSNLGIVGRKTQEKFILES